MPSSTRGLIAALLALASLTLSACASSAEPPAGQATGGANGQQTCQEWLGLTDIEKEGAVRKITMKSGKEPEDVGGWRGFLRTCTSGPDKLLEQVVEQQIALSPTSSTPNQPAESPSESSDSSFTVAASLTIETETADGYSGRVEFRFASPREITVPTELVDLCDMAETVPFGEEHVVVRALKFSAEVKDTTKAGFELADGSLNAALLPQGGGAVCGDASDFLLTPQGRFPLPVDRIINGDIVVYGKVSPNTPDPLAAFGKVQVMVMESQKSVGELPCAARATGNVAISAGNKNCTALVDVSN